MTIRLTAAAIVVALTAGWATHGVGAQEPAAGDGASSPSEACDPEVLGDLCPSASALAVVVASVCEEIAGPHSLCRAVDPGVADPAAVDAFEQSWTARALQLQHHLDDDVPLVDALVPHTHNSYNSTAYPVAVSNLDPNQRYTAVDQLRMGMRSIELDLHLFGGQIVLCHGQTVPVGPIIVHAGCSIDRSFATGLVELRQWLDAPGNAGEFLVLYLENQLDGDTAAHNRAAALVERHLGDLVIRPPAQQPCGPMPLDDTQASLTSGGGRVLIVGNCGPGDWGGWVHERGPRWNERNNTAGYPSYPGCVADRDRHDYDSNWIRVYEDSTWLSSLAGSGSSVTVDEVRAMVRCGVNMVGFDRLAPTDPRLDALIWSWAPDEPSATPGHDCAYLGADRRFHDADCSEERAFACQTPEGAWRVTEERGAWVAGEPACIGLGDDFAVPANGWENEQLAQAVAEVGAGQVWLNYAAGADGWQVGPDADPNPDNAVAIIVDLVRALGLHRLF